MKRTIIQIAATPDTTDYHPELYALCDDGTLWQRSMKGPAEHRKWTKVDDVPQEWDEPKSAV